MSLASRERGLEEIPVLGMDISRLINFLGSSNGLLSRCVQGKYENLFIYHKLVLPSINKNMIHFRRHTGGPKKALLDGLFQNKLIEGQSMTFECYKLKTSPE